MPGKKLVVVGGDAAGMSAASQAKRRFPELDVVVFEKGRTISYAACGMPYLVEKAVERPEELVVLTADQARSKRGIDVRLEHEVVDLDPAAGRVRVRNVALGTEEWVGYDACVIATGAAAVVPPIEGVQLEGVFTLRSFESGVRFRRFVDERAPERAVVVGAGLVGLEMAEALTVRGARVTILEMLPGPLLGLVPELGRLVEEELARHGCTLLLQTALERLEGRDGRVTEALAGGERFPADVVLLSVGVRPVSDLARSAGLELGVKGAIRVDEYAETSHAGIYAAGDCAEQRHGVTGKPVFLPQALPANRQGRVAGANAGARLAGLDQKVENAPVMGTLITKVFDLEVARTGLSPVEAQAEGFDVGVTVITARDRAHYYPKSSPFHVALIYEKGTGRLLGGQMVGRSGAVKRIDVLVTALEARFDLERLSGLDLAYAPPFSPVWDPILVAANVAKKKV